MSKRRGLILVALIVVVSVTACLKTNDYAAMQRWPAPIDTGPGERDPDFKVRRAEWIESLHRHAPGVDWRAQDSAWRAARMARVQEERHAALAAGASAGSLRRVANDVISGIWRERGSSNQAGRITGAVLDVSNDRLSILSQGGNLWRADLGTLEWTSPNDSASFISSGFIDRLAGSSGERLLLASDTPLGVYRSDDGGATYTAAAGTDMPNPWYTMSMAMRDEAANEVYLARVHYDVSVSEWRPLLFASTDRGASFTSIGFVGARDRVALFSPRYGSAEVYALVDADLKRIASGTQAFEAISRVPVSPPVAEGDRVHLVGGIEAGQTFLYALYSRVAGHTDVYRSLDGGLTWQARSPVPTGTFGPNSAASSTRDSNVLYVGGVNLYRSVDGGATWLPVNDWTEYYGDPANKLHADIPSIDVWRDSADAERVYVSTDGGLYESTDNVASVHNLSLDGLHVSQYYSTYTQRGRSRVVLAGAQDQGYQKALSPGGAIDDFVQVISGDYAHLDSADGGDSVWMVYPTFAMLDLQPGNGTQAGLRLWDFAPNSLSGTLWLAPLVADPSNPLRAMLAGGTLFGAPGNHVVTLTWSRSAFNAAQDSFDFGSQVTALAYSPHAGGERYAINSNQEFFRYAGGNWSNTASGLPAHHYFYGNRILIDPLMPGTIYVAGAGYSNPAVFVSTNFGASFTPMSAGLPATLVFDIAVSSDGQQMFAATEVGPFYFDRAQAVWVDISGLGGPDQRYWDVDYIDDGGSGIARFATYGRGIWDFVATDPDVIFRNGFDD